MRWPRCCAWVWHRVRAEWPVSPAHRMAASPPCHAAVNAYVAAEVLPYVPDAWVDHAKTKIGFEIPLRAPLPSRAAPSARGDRRRGQSARGGDSGTPPGRDGVTRRSRRGRHSVVGPRWQVHPASGLRAPGVPSGRLSGGTCEPCGTSPRLVLVPLFQYPPCPGPIGPVEHDPPDNTDSGIRLGSMVEMAGAQPAPGPSGHLRVAASDPRLHLDWPRARVGRAAFRRATQAGGSGPRTGAACPGLQRDRRRSLRDRTSRLPQAGAGPWDVVTATRSLG